ncbi:MAG: NAD-dependent epimerase/dehydratase [Candidatus Amesbacteria bacterium GW2011_GWB1_47_26]|uniref:GDP-L-fucose synthase n=1 Tax=Candidatus Amesbacteria bacterium GW2011_GWC2_45_19 TaxID=1618366 RepID=A0A0G1PDL8_9BACT|nr:MAG: NAD-dependent epimerase/dehydratase [Candidatus Amesbacteria bacterium GW2011_GWC2_45_19]KKU38422.1 MAG: NAD-dependent epimerase/dehydratase [Candidatus Amesbacteria bacterium GW2011_GWA1_46_35]KKU69499.1 MAG: NAD-dependent epimerase/dehydratase [Microgenomates group bacterium GW2011_GWC1_47_20]KKU75164.1 MAG: NAD-dependent epimerase/dehydratase [Candidatus Amesbacteria bacterium GW2011_GWB1_47_26]KKU80322.1 MAG: NAD-dependent epimerase/dehydratase [Candidatus Amesbacteria bacterium GW2
MKYLNYFKGRRVVITGGNGFFGTHIINHLRQIKCEILVPRTKEGIDFRKREDCFSYLNIAKPDLVINCAANQGGIGYHEGKQADLLMDNLLMGIYLMNASQQTGVKKFINIVAGCSYPGYVESSEMNEEDYWNGWVHDSIFSYGFARKASTVYGLALKRQHNFNSIHLVMANMYGPGEHFNPEQSKALAGLIRKIYEAKKKKLHFVKVWGTGKPIRDWLYVKDGAEAILRAASTYNNVDPLNIATGVGISVSELAETIKEVLGYEGKLVYDTSKPDGALHKLFGIKKMKKILNWIPPTSLRKGIKETVQWFDKNYQRAISY